MPDREALEAALDHLYDVDPAEFTATRARLAVALRTVDADAAKRLKAARRPTTAAWVLNRLSRDEPSLVRDYFERSTELREAQAGARDGGRDALRDATRAQRDALASLTDAALARLGDRANDSYRAQVVATLHAAVVDDTVGEELRKGRLIKEVSGASGFPSVPELTVVPPLPPERPTKRKPPRRPSSRPSKSDATAGKARPDRDAASGAADEVDQVAASKAAERAAREERAERALADAEHAAEEARADADAAETAAAAAHAHARRLEDDLDRAKREARAADTEAARSRREAARLERVATKLRSRLPPG